MEIILYKCTDDKRKCGKTLNSKTSKTIMARGETVSVESPTFLLDFNEDLLLFNYCYIPKFKRYYFISWSGEVAHRMRMTCDVDVLESFKTELKKKTLYIVRQEFKFNKWFPDSMLPATTQINYKCRPFGVVSSEYEFYLTVNGGVK